MWMTKQRVVGKRRFLPPDVGGIAKRRRLGQMSLEVNTGYNGASSDVDNNTIGRQKRENGGVNQ